MKLILSIFSLYASLSAWTVLEHPGSLTSSFLESRGTRYHAGVDLSTGGKIGLPIYAPEEGKIIRVRVSPYGYGKAIYFEGVSQKVYVFAHLNGFEEKFWEDIYGKMLQRKQATLDLKLKEKERPFYHKGQILAYSGNTGIGKPHLHVEVRPSPGKVENPIHHGLKSIDSLQPEVNAIAFKGKQGWELYQFQSDTLNIHPKHFSNFSQGALQIIDYADAQKENPLSIHSLELSQGKHTLFKKNYRKHYYGKMDEILEDLYSDLGDQKGDWHLLDIQGKRYNHLSTWQDFNSKKPLKITVKDGHGNLRSYVIKPHLSNPPSFVPNSIYALKPTNRIELTLPSYKASILGEDSTWYAEGVDSNGTAFYQPSQKSILLAGKAKICLLGAVKKTEGLFYKGSNEWNSFSNQIREREKICVQTKDLRTVALGKDDRAPKILTITTEKKLWNHKLSPGIVVRYSEKPTPDILFQSGIGSSKNISIKIDNKWTYFELDPEEETLWIPGSFKNATLHITIRDDFGNQTEKSFEL